MTIADFPRYTFLHEPTLLQPLRRTGKALGHPSLYVKRDDLMPIAVGGNKLRSLEFWVGAAMQEKADVLLVAGAPVSNQCRLTAAAASIAGLDCHIYHNAEDGLEARRASYLSRLFGASLHFLGPLDEHQRGIEVENAAAEFRRAGRRPYIVGNAAIGGLGYVRAAEELLVQSRASGADIRHVFLPGSMGPTEAGFIFGNALLGHPFQVHLASVEYGQAEFSARVQRIYEAIAELAGPDAPEFNDAVIHYHMDFLGDGYARPSPESEAAIIAFARTEGILLEHTYTGKTFACFLDLVRRRVIPADEPACIIHTGGVPSLFTQFGLFREVPLMPGS